MKNKELQNSTDWINKFLTLEQRQSIAKAIQNAEKGTSAEIVPVIVRSSSANRYIPFVLSFFIGSIVTIEILNLFFEENWLFLTLGLIFSNILIFLSSFWFCRFDFMQRLFLNELDMNKQVFQRAELEFYKQRIDKTFSKTGVLLFVSVLERKVIIYGDKSIYFRIEQSEWNKIITMMIQYLKKNDWESGFLKSINEIGMILKAHLPLDNSQENPNELSNELRILN